MFRLKLLLVLRLAVSAAALSGGLALAQTPPPATSVFRLGADRGEGGELSLRWAIAAGNYLYRDKIKIESSDGRSIPAAIPSGETKDDPNFGPTQIFHNNLIATIDPAAISGLSKLSVTYQGCAERGICYPPITSHLDLTTLQITGGDGLPAKTESAAQESTWTELPSLKTTAESPSNAGRNAETTSPELSASWPSLIATFIGFGLLLAFTPCIFPMIPILGGILSRSDRQLTALRGFSISITYVLAMAIAYAALGVAAAWSGQNLQVVLQTPLAIGMMAAIFVALALSSFGLFELRLPASWTQFADTGGWRGGSFLGAAALGFTSALIVGPCVTPPLAAALLYVAQTGDVSRGAAALFALGFGMGMPLVVFGTFGASIMPRSGSWLRVASRIFGVVFLGLALYLIQRLIPAPVSLALWGLLALGTGVFSGAFDRLSGAATPALRLRKTGGLAAVIYGAALIVGAAGGGDDPLRPLAVLATRPAAEIAAGQNRVTKVTARDFDATLNRARNLGKPILVDFTADWCTACKDMDRNVLSDPSIERRLKEFTVIRADVTSSNTETAALLQRFGVVGPPTLIVLRASDGQEIATARTTGETTVEGFNAALDKASS